MSASPRVVLSQLELVCAILNELDRQNPGAQVHQDVMNDIIEAADAIVASARRGLSLESPE